MKTLTLDLMLVMVRLLGDIGSFGELSLGVSFRLWMTSLIFGSSELFSLNCIELSLHYEGDIPNFLSSNLLVLVDCPTESISSTDFGSYVWNHPRFRFLAQFCFPNMYCCSREENIVEIR